MFLSGKQMSQTDQLQRQTIDRHHLVCGNSLSISLFGDSYLLDCYHGEKGSIKGFQLTCVKQETSSVVGYILGQFKSESFELSYKAFDCPLDPSPSPREAVWVHPEYRGSLFSVGKSSYKGFGSFLFQLTCLMVHEYFQVQQLRVVCLAQSYGFYARHFNFDYDLLYESGASIQSLQAVTEKIPDQFMFARSF